MTSQEEFSTEKGAEVLLKIIKANCPYPEVKFWVERSDFGLFVVRSNLLRGLPREKEGEKQGVSDSRRNLQSKANGGGRLHSSGKVHDK